MLALDQFNIDNQIESNAFKEAFRSQFKDSDGIVVNKLARYVGEFSSWRFFSPIGILAQSSGYGKTRSLYEHAKKHVTVYICCRSADSIAESYPNRSILAYYLEKSFQAPEYSNKGELFLAALARSTLDELKKIEKKSNHKEAIAIEFMKSQPWLDYPKDEKNRVSYYI